MILVDSLTCQQISYCAASVKSAKGNIVILAQAEYLLAFRQVEFKSEALFIGNIEVLTAAKYSFAV